MKKELINYFEGLKNEKLPMIGRRYAEDGVVIRKFRNREFDVGYDHVHTYLFDDKPMCVKEMSSCNEDGGDVFEIVSGDYFNSVGCLSVVGYPMDLVLRGNYTGQEYFHFGVATHHLKGIGEIEVCPAGYVLYPNAQPPTNMSKDSWYLLEDSKLKERLLKIITPECFDEYIKLFLADRVGGYCDRRLGNYFFYRENGSRKWEGLIAIDNAMTTTGLILNEKIIK